MRTFLISILPIAFIAACGGTNSADSDSQADVSAPLNWYVYTQCSTPWSNEPAGREYPDPTVQQVFEWLADNHVEFTQIGIQWGTARNPCASGMQIIMQASSAIDGFQLFSQPPLPSPFGRNEMALPATYNPPWIQQGENLGTKQAEAVLVSQWAASFGATVDYAGFVYQPQACPANLGGCVPLESVVVSAHTVQDADTLQDNHFKPMVPICGLEIPGTDGGVVGCVD